MSDRILGARERHWQLPSAHYERPELLGADDPRFERFLFALGVTGNSSRCCSLLGYHCK